MTEIVSSQLFQQQGGSVSLLHLMHLNWIDLIVRSIGPAQKCKLQNILCCAICSLMAEITGEDVAAAAGQLHPQRFMDIKGVDLL